MLRLEKLVRVLWEEQCDRHRLRTKSSHTWDCLSITSMGKSMVWGIHTLGNLQMELLYKLPGKWQHLSHPCHYMPPGSMFKSQLPQAVVSSKKLPPVIIHRCFGFSIINHPAIGIPPWPYDLGNPHDPSAWHRSMTILSWIFCHKWARKIWISEIFKVGILPRQRFERRRFWTWHFGHGEELTKFLEILGILEIVPPTCQGLKMFKTVKN